MITHDHVKWLRHFFIISCLFCGFLSHESTGMEESTLKVMSWGRVKDLKEPVTAIAAGGDYFGVVTSDRTVTGWTSHSMARPVYLDNVRQLKAGKNNVAALLMDSTVVVWHHRDTIPNTTPEPHTHIIAFDVGDSHFVALKDDGTVVAWGNNEYGQTAVPEKLSDVKAIAAGARHTLALKKNGTLVAWGDPKNYKTFIPPQLNDVAAIDVGDEHNVALREDGTVYAWGGQNVHNEITVPADLNDVMMIRAGPGYTIAVKADGSMVCWGTLQNPWNRTGQCLRNKDSDKAIRDIAAGKGFVSILYNDGSLDMCGDHAYHSEQTPTDLNDIVKLVAGHNLNLALKNDGTIRLWGNLESYGLAFPEGLSNIKDIFANDYGNAFVIQEDGTPFICGGFGYGDARIEDYKRIKSLAFGTWHTAILHEYGKVSIQPARHPGYKLYGHNPPPADLLDVTAIAAGGSHTAALKQDGTVVAWSGDADYDLSYEWANIISVECGYGFILGLTSNGTVISYGLDDNAGTISKGLKNVIKIAAQGYCAAALHENGTVTMLWDDTFKEYGGRRTDRYGLSNVPEEARDITDIALGSGHIVALRKDKTVVAWGDNRYGQCDIPTHLRNVNSIAAGDEHTAVIYEERATSLSGGAPEGTISASENSAQQLVVSFHPKNRSLSFSPPLNSESVCLLFNARGRLILQAPTVQKTLTLPARASGGLIVWQISSKDGFQTRTGRIVLP